MVDCTRFKHREYLKLTWRIGLLDANAVTLTRPGCDMPQWGELGIVGVQNKQGDP